MCFYVIYNDLLIYFLFKKCTFNTLFIAEVECCCGKGEKTVFIGKVKPVITSSFGCFHISTVDVQKIVLHKYK